MQIKDRVFVVTGGSSGLGAAVTRQFVADGAQVVIADITEPPARPSQQSSAETCASHRQT